MNVYSAIGLLLLIAGLVLSGVSWFIVGSVYLTVCGLAFVLVGVVCLLVGVEFEVNPEPFRVLGERGLLNLRLLVEGLEVVDSEPIYLPSSMVAGGLPLALIPVRGGVESVSGFRRRLGVGLVARFGGGVDDVGVLVATAGTVIVRELGGFGRVEDAAGLEGVLSRILVNRLKVASSVSVVGVEGGFRVRVGSPGLWMVRVEPFGCFYCEVVGQVVAECLGRPVRVCEVRVSRREVVLDVKVL